MRHDDRVNYWRSKQTSEKWLDQPQYLFVCLSFYLRAYEWVNEQNEKGNMYARQICVQYKTIMALGHSDCP